jgi:hypothetical protein
VYVLFHAHVFHLLFALYSHSPSPHGFGLGDELATPLRVADLVIFTAFRKSFPRIVYMLRGPELTLIFYVAITIGL